MSTELAWSAGFYDGEGCCTQNNAGQRSKSASVAISQSSFDGMIPEVLLRFQLAVGLGKINGPYHRPGRRPHYRWVLNRRKDIDTLFTLLWPYLGKVKREQAIQHGYIPGGSTT